MGYATRSFAAAGGVLALGSVALAQVPWSNASGSGSFFTWANGQNTNNFFGSPSLQGGSQFVFIPSNFVANAAGNSSQTTSDQFDVDLHAFAGYKFTEIRIQVLGDYSITPPGSVNVTGALNIHDLIGPRSTVDPLGTNPAMPITAGGSGSWSGNAYRDLSLIELGTPFTDVHISFSNSLFAVSTGGSATVENTITGFPIAVTIIPEPGALGGLALAGLLAARRRRR